MLDCADALGVADGAAAGGLGALLTASWEATQLPPDATPDAFHAALVAMRDAFDSAVIGADRDQLPGTARDRPWMMCAAIEASTIPALLTALYLTRATETN